MDRQELLSDLYEFAFECKKHSVKLNDNNIEKYYRAISKSELIPDKEYEGVCRNASKATWSGKKFIYKRHKFGTTYSEEINHYEDDDGYDVFVPIEYIGED